MSHVFFYCVPCHYILSDKGQGLTEGPCPVCKSAVSTPLEDGLRQEAESAFAATIRLLGVTRSSPYASIREAAAKFAAEVAEVRCEEPDQDEPPP
jgi:hypothetical protein